MKNNKNKKISLKKLMKEDISNLLATQGPQDQALTTDLSLDEKVDHFLIQYERESVPISAQYQESKLSLKRLMSTLFEADENKPEDEEQIDDNEAGGLGDIGGDTGDAGGGLDLGSGGGGFGGSSGGGGGGGMDLGGDTTGGGEVKTGPAPVPTPKINISNYAKSVARLINNYQTLISPQRIILNRARAYVEKNYNPSVAKELMNILDVEYNLSQDSLTNKEDEVEVPAAAGALSPIGGS